MRYSIGEFSDLLGITIDTIRLYETYGIISPIKDHKSNYRYFDDLDARNLLMSRWYRSLSFSLKSSARFTLESDYEEVYQQIGKKRKALETEIREKQYLLNRIDEIEREFENLKRDLGTYRLISKPAIYRIKQTVQDELIEPESSKRLVKSFMSALPHTFYSLIISEDILSHQSGDCNQEDIVEAYDWGLAIYEPDLLRLECREKCHLDYFTESQYFSTTICVDYDQKMQKSLFTAFYNEAVKRGYKICGSLIGRLIFIEKVSEKRISYIEISIPIES